MLVDPLVRKTRPFSISKGCPQSTSRQVGGQADQDPEDKHSMSSSPLRLNPSSQIKVAVPPIRKVLKIMDPLAGDSRGLQRVSLQDGASGSHFPLVSHRRLSKPENDQRNLSNKMVETRKSYEIILWGKYLKLELRWRVFDLMRFFSRWVELIRHNLFTVSGFCFQFSHFSSILRFLS